MTHETSAVTVACCQVAPRVGALDHNRHLSIAAISDAAGQGAHVVVLPELMQSGYVFSDHAEALVCGETADGPTVQAWAALAKQLDIVIVAGFCERLADDRLANSAVLVDARGVQAVYRKVHLWNHEKHIFTPGTEAPPVVDTRFGRIAVMVCYDLEFPEWVRLPALAGAQLLCAPVNWPDAPRPLGERPAEVVRVQANAAVNRMFIAACDRVGEERGVDWVGGSVIVDADGYPLAGPVSDASLSGHLLIAHLDLAEANHKGISELNDVHRDRQSFLYGESAV